jgi:putative Holliday junction resolvase
MRIGGLDVGDRRIGVAVSDERGWTAQGYLHSLRLARER